MKLFESTLDDKKYTVGLIEKSMECDALSLQLWGEGDVFAQGVYQETPHRAVTWCTEKEITNWDKVWRKLIVGSCSGEGRRREREEENIAMSGRNYIVKLRQFAEIIFCSYVVHCSYSCARMWWHTKNPDL